MCRVYTAGSEKKNALACVTLAMAVLSVQVNLVLCICVFTQLSNLYLEIQIGSKVEKHRYVHTEEMNGAASLFILMLGSVFTVLLLRTRFNVYSISTGELLITLRF